MPFKIHPFFYTKTKKFLGMEGKRKPGQKVITRTLDLNVRWKGRLSPETRVRRFAGSHLMSPCVLYPSLVSSYSRYQDVCNYSVLSPALEEVTGHKTVINGLPCLPSIFIPILLQKKGGKCWKNLLLFQTVFKKL